MYNDIQFDNLLTPQTSRVIQTELLENCERGAIQVDYNSFLQTIKEKLSLEESETQQILLSAADSDLITIQSRQLTQYHKLNLVSLKIHVFSL